MCTTSCFICNLYYTFTLKMTKSIVALTFLVTFITWFYSSLEPPLLHIPLFLGDIPIPLLWPWPLPCPLVLDSPYLDEKYNYSITPMFRVEETLSSWETNEPICWSNSSMEIYLVSSSVIIFWFYLGNNVLNTVFTIFSFEIYSPRVFILLT